MKLYCIQEAIFSRKEDNKGEFRKGVIFNNSMIAGENLPQEKTIYRIGRECVKDKIGKQTSPIKYCSLNPGYCRTVL